jgi:hypothetical protein
MDKWKAIQVGGTTVLVWAISSHVLKDPGTDESHGHKESQNGPGHQMGRDAVEMVVNTGASSGPPPIGHREILNRILASWYVAPPFDNTEIMRRHRLVVQG